MRTLFALSLAFVSILSANTPTFVKDVAFFKLPDQVPNSTHSFISANTSTRCTPNQNLRINSLHEQMVAMFFSGKEEALKKRQPLVSDEVDLLTQIAEQRLATSLNGTTRNPKDECENTIAQLEAHSDFVLSIYKKGYVVTRNEGIYSLLKNKLLGLAPTFELVEFMAKNLLSYHYMHKLDPQIKNDSGFAVFLLFRTLENNNPLYPLNVALTKTNKDQAAKIYLKMSNSFKRYQDVLNVALGSPNGGVQANIHTNDYLATYVELNLIEKSPEHLKIFANDRYFNTRAYLSTLLKLADLFPNLVTNSNEYRNSFNKIFSAEAIANKVFQEKVGTREWLMAFIPSTTSNPRYTEQFNLVANDLRTHLLNSNKNDSLTVSEKLSYAAHVLRLSNNIMTLKPTSVAKVVEMRQGIQAQLKEGKSIAQTTVPVAKVQGI